MKEYEYEIWYSYIYKRKVTDHDWENTQRSTNSQTAESRIQKLDSYYNVSEH